MDVSGINTDIKRIFVPIDEKSKHSKNTQIHTKTSLDAPDELKPKKNRVITKTSRWNTMKTTVDLYDPFFQVNCLNWMEQDGLVKSSLESKLRGYKSQDIEKKLFDETLFVTYDYVIDLLKTSNMQCFYCKGLVMILYETVREPKQWTLERIDNKLGHNVNNVQISCLTCNLRRRTIFQERYILTKKLTNIQKVDYT